MPCGFERKIYQIEAVRPEPRAAQVAQRLGVSVRDYDRLREQLGRFDQLLDVRYEMRYRNIEYRPSRIMVDYTYTASFKIATPEGDRWETRLRDNRIELVREDDQFRIVSGI